MKKLEPADVADAIVDALKRGVVDVWVPRSARHTHRLAALLPRRASEGVARAMKADRVLMGADKQARAAYELRAAQLRARPRARRGAAPAHLLAAAQPARRRANRPMPAGALPRLHRQPGVGERPARGAGAHQRGDADGRVGPHGPVRGLHAQVLGRLADGVGRRVGRVHVGVREQRGDLVVAHVGDDVGPAQAPAHDVEDPRDEPVGRLGPVARAHVGQPVQRAAHERGLLAVAPAAQQLVAHGALEGALAGRAREHPARRLPRWSSGASVRCHSRHASAPSAPSTSEAEADTRRYEPSARARRHVPRSTITRRSSTSRRRTSSSGRSAGWVRSCTMRPTSSSAPKPSSVHSERFTRTMRPSAEISAMAAGATWKARSRPARAVSRRAWTRPRATSASRRTFSSSAPNGLTTQSCAPASSRPGTSSGEAASVSSGTSPRRRRSAAIALEPGGGVEHDGVGAAVGDQARGLQRVDRVDDVVAAADELSDVGPELGVAR